MTMLHSESICISFKKVFKKVFPNLLATYSSWILLMRDSVGCRCDCLKSLLKAFIRKQGKRKLDFALCFMIKKLTQFWGAVCLARANLQGVWNFNKTTRYLAQQQRWLISEPEKMKQTASVFNPMGKAFWGVIQLLCAKNQMAGILPNVNIPAKSYRS